MNNCQSQQVCLPKSLIFDDFTASVVELGEITNFADEQTFDIVVVGAGCAGVPAVLTALEEGATVACLQKGKTPAANGRAVSGIQLEASTPGGLQRYISDWARANDWRVNRDLFNHWVQHSGETLNWITKRSVEIGSAPEQFSTEYAVVYEDGGKAANYFTRNKNRPLMINLARKAVNEGAAFFYETPAVQLVKEGDRVTGAIGQDLNTGSYIKLNATKAVILAAGDYQNNASLVSRYCGDMDGFTFSLEGRTGDGHILGTLAGGRIVPANHPRQVHANFTTGGQFVGPYLHLDPNGKRFMNEEPIMTSWNTEMKYHYKEKGDVMVYRFFDAAIEEKYPGTGTVSRANELIEKNKERFVVDGVFCKADTLEELLRKLKLPVEASLASIERYNELCAQGSDIDFGKRPEYMKPLDTPPYYGVGNRFRCCSINGGLVVDEHYQVVDEANNPIPGLFAAGTNGGDVCGGINWTMPTGLSNGHCFTAGRYSVVYALTNGLTPSHPVSFDEVSSYFADEDGGFTWDKPEKARKSIPLW